MPRHYKVQQDEAQQFYDTCLDGAAGLFNLILKLEVLTIPAWNRLRSMNLALFWRYLMAIPDPALF